MSRDTERPPISDLDQYQRAALRTIGANTLTTAVLGLCGESGEIADYLKKALAQGHPFERGVMKKELGDVLWYVSAVAHLLDMNLSEIAQANVDKLLARYPDGFEPGRSLNRSEEEVP